jgi:hypothetical protein
MTTLAYRPRRERPDVKVLACTECGDTFERVGDVPIRTAKPSTPNINPQTGMQYEGKCPKHSS